MSKFYFPLLVLAMSQYCLANTPLEIPRLSSTVAFDGIPNETAWEEATTLPLTMQMPTYGKQPTEKSDVLIAFDDDYLYLAGRLYESEPGKVMANSKKRDAMVGNTDWFGLIIDSYYDRENALAFFTNPNGLRLDVNVFNDAISMNDFNVSWNTFWDVKTIVTDKGWFAEIRIPFSSLPFQSKDGEVTMGITAWRWIAHKNEVDIFPAISNDFGDMSSWKPSLSHPVVLKDLTSKKPFYIAPYILGGFGQSHEVNEAETAYEKIDDPTYEAGLDIKYGLNNNLTLDVSLNTDFAQVEVDDQQINLSRFSLFFPEKRLFFQERAGIFNYNFGREDQLFYSRRIGITDDGDPVRIYGGARVVGRMGKWDLGLMNMQTATFDTINSENFSVARLRKQVINENSDVGAILTNRMDFQGNYNSTYGFDATIRVYKNDFLSLRWAQTFQNDSPNQVLSLDPTRLWISIARQQFKGFTYAASYSRSGFDFNPSMGFQGREDFHRHGSRLSYGWITGEKSKLQRHGILYRGAFFWSLQEKKLETYAGGLGWEFATKSGAGGEIKANYQVENLFRDTLEFTEKVKILPGEYKFPSLEANFFTSQSRAFNAMGNIEVGNFYDGKKYTFGLTPNFAASSSLELSGTYEFNHIRFPNRDLVVNLHIARLKLLYMFSTKLSVSSFVQYNSSAHTFLANVRLRYNPKEGNDLYIVYNDELNTDRDRELLLLPKSNARAIVLKYTYTFRI